MRRGLRCRLWWDGKCATRSLGQVHPQVLAVHMVAMGGMRLLPGLDGVGDKRSWISSKQLDSPPWSVSSSVERPPVKREGMGSAPIQTATWWEIVSMAAHGSMLGPESWFESTLSSNHWGVV